MRSIALIGHSHAVSILDGIGEWRTQARLRGDWEDARYTRAFQGWLSVDTSGKLFQVETYPEFAKLSGIRVCLITPATFPGELAIAGTRETGEADATSSSFLAAFLSQVSDFDAIVSVINRSEHAWLALINNLPEYDFLPFQEAPKGQPVDRQYIDAIVGEMAMHVVTPLFCVRRSIENVKILHVPPPPPLREPANASVLEVLKEHVEQHGFVRASLTQKWYMAYLEKLRVELAALNIDLLDPRFEEACEDGFLKPEYAEGLTHGNSAYGRLVGFRIMQMLGL